MTQYLCDPWVYFQQRNYCIPESVEEFSCVGPEGTLGNLEHVFGRGANTFTKVHVRKAKRRIQLLKALKTPIFKI